MVEPRRQPHARLKEEVDALIAAGRYAEAAEALRRLIAVEPDCHPALQKLGVCCLRTADLAAAERALLEAARRLPADPGAFDGLAETYGQLGDLTRARQAGRRALVLRDGAIPLRLGPPPAVPPRPGGAGLVAFSLFGDLPRYCETAVVNAAAVPALLPGWTCRFYADATVPADVLGRLASLGAEVVMVDEARRSLPATMWRFLALDDPAAAAVICRDADALAGARDAGWIGEWMASALPFHIVRDYFSHCELILAGLFGVRGGVLGGVEAAMRRWLQRAGPPGRWTDQHFLRETVWPAARDAALTHDPWFAYGSLVAPGTSIAADPREHVGANHGSTSFEIKLDRPDGATVRWALVDAAGVPVTSSYAGAVRGGCYAVDIPLSHAARVRAGEWKLRWSVTDPPRATSPTPCPSASSG